MSASTETIELALVSNDQASKHAEPVAAVQHVYPSMSPLRAAIVYITVAGTSFACSMTTGCLATGTPDIAARLNIPDGLILWPSAIYSLTSGCTFILTGAIADVVGSRKVYLFGCVFLALTTLACGLARDTTELMVYRGLQGVAASCCLPTAVSLLARAFPPGRSRTRGIAILGASYTFGYSAGLFLGGLFVETIGWRWGWYAAAIFIVFVFVGAIWALPPEHKVRGKIWSRLASDVDWVGAVLVSGCLGLISYVLATTSASTDNIKQPVNIALLVLGVALGPVAGYWMSFQERRNKAALIPTSVWPNRYFTTICAMLFLASTVLNSSEVFFSLFFQKVQRLSALQASLRFIPEIVIGAAFSFSTDALLHRVSTYRFVMIVAVGSILSPLFMGLMQPQWSYWYMEFWAMSLLPMAADVLFVVGAVIVTDTFPLAKQAVAGSIFNTMYQYGSAVGVGAMSVAANVVTADSSFSDKNEPYALLEGYRATFWACLGASIVYCAIGGFGLKGIGKVGLKTE